MVVSREANSILNYETAQQWQLVQAEALLEDIRLERQQFEQTSYIRYCAICGKRFETRFPDDPCCSGACKQEHTTQLEAWIDAKFKSVLPKAVAILQANPVREWVYFIQAGVNGPIKIGYSTDCTARLSELQTSSPEPLQMLCIINGDRNLEASLHNRFSHLRRSGEWFDPDESLLTLIGELKSGADLDESVR